jgi:D-alanyl-D-alanine carboxypeptidase (penicillin-binding protein 5/6)
LFSTRYQNPAGLDDSNQQTSGHDLAILAKEVIKDPFLSELVATTHKDITSVAATTSAESKISLWNTNQLLYNYEQAKGVKTGTTDAAGQVLVTLWRENGHDLLIVVMNSKNRYQDTLALVDWTKENISWVDINGL